MSNVSQYQEEGKVLTFPIFCLILYFVTEYARIEVLGPLQLALVSQIFLLLSLLKDISRVQEIITDKYFKFYFYLLILMVFHIVFARNNYWAFMQFRLMITYLIVTLSCCVFLDTERKLRFIISLFVFIHLLAGLNWALGLSLIGNSGPLGDENDFALAMNVVMPISFFLGLNAQGFKRFYYWIGCIILITGNVIAGSRGGFIGLVCVAGLCLLSLKSKLKALLVACAAAAVFWMCIPDSYKDDIYTISSETSQETGTTGYGRTQVWDLAWRVFVHDPIVGVGQGNINYRLGDYVEESSAADYWKDRPGQSGRATHSVYFTVLPELGLIGTMLFILMVKSNFDKCKKMRTDTVSEQQFLKYLSTGLIIGLVGYLTTGVFLSALYYPQIWNLSAFILASHIIFTRRALAFSRSA